MRPQTHTMRGKILHSSSLPPNTNGNNLSHKPPLPSHPAKAAQHSVDRPHQLRLTFGCVDSSTFFHIVMSIVILFLEFILVLMRRCLRRLHRLLPILFFLGPLFDSLHPIRRTAIRNGTQSTDKRKLRRGTRNGDDNRASRECGRSRARLLRDRKVANGAGGGSVLPADAVFGQDDAVAVSSVEQVTAKRRIREEGVPLLLQTKNLSLLVSCAHRRRIAIGIG
ncbi:hypothetical protein BC567DRAFT_224293 [Phyllosticta citribraziliensis]